MEISFTQSITLRGITKTGTGRLYLQFFLNKQRDYCKTDYRIPIKNWSTSKQQVVGNYPKKHDINVYLEQIKSRASEFVYKARLAQRQISCSELKSHLDDNGDPNSFIDYMRMEIESRKPIIAKASYNQHHKVLRRVCEFKKELMFHQVNAKFLNDFKSHLVKTRNHDINTIHHHFKTIKTYVRRAIQDKYMNENPFDYFKLTRVEGNHTWLTSEEFSRLWRLYNRNELENYLQNSLRAFIYSGLTGMRPGDIRHINKKQHQGDFLLYTPRKTIKKKRKTIHVRISPELKQLIKELPYSMFDLPTDATINRHLKIIAQAVGIEKNLTFYVARHTFATIFLLTCGNLKKLQELMGHSNLKETMIYAHVLSRDADEEVLLLSSVLTGQSNSSLSIAG